MNNKDWEFIVDLEKGNEDCPALHPLARCDNFSEIQAQLYAWELEYKNKYDELRIQFYSRSLGYGAKSESWALEGRYLDETKRLLYGKQQ